MVARPAPAATSASPADAARREATPDAVALALRLGTAALGTPIVYAADGAMPGFDPSDPHIAFAHEEPVRADGAVVGLVRAVDIRPRPPVSDHDRTILQDVSALIAASHESRLAIGRTDHVTGLPNRLRFIADYAAGAARGPEKLLVLITVAEAKQFNDILRAIGHGFAEDFVRTCIANIRRHVDPAIGVYHVSVLSFAFLIDAGQAEPPVLVRDILSDFARPMACSGVPLNVRLGVGMTPFQPGVTKPAEALRAALIAAQDGRRSERQWSFYDRKSDEAHLRAFLLLNDLRTAIETRQQLHLVYQPRIDLATGRLDGAEVLMRWTHPTLGAISPAEFIPLAEATALMGPLTDTLLHRTAGQLQAWSKEGFDPALSLNVSPTSFHDGDFAGKLVGILDRYGVPARQIEVECTEGSLASSEPLMHRQIEMLRALGMRIAIDDFGTGYSNMNYLTRLPVDVLKIDQSFVRPLHADPRHRLLVKTMIDMAHGLGCRVVAEGIETAEIYDLVAGWGCDEGQGYFMSRPLPPAEFATWAAAHR